MLKKLSATVLAISLSLGFCSLHTSASQPGFFLMSRIQQTPMSALNIAPVFDRSEYNQIALMRNLENFIEKPVRELIDRFTKGYTFCTDETDVVYPIVIRWVYSDNEEILAVAQKIKVVSSIASMLRAYESRAFSRVFEPRGFEAQYAKIQEISREVRSINEALDKISAKKPSQEDVKAGKCKDFRFYGFL